MRHGRIISLMIVGLLLVLVGARGPAGVLPGVAFAAGSAGNPPPPAPPPPSSGPPGPGGPLPGTASTPYGYALPGDPVYGFGLLDNNARDFLGLVAKGNVVLGDYTPRPDPVTGAETNPFLTAVLPLLRDTGAASITQPYVVDPTDQNLGYHDYAPSPQGFPRFSGNYDQVDSSDGVAGTGQKLDASPRRFYESTLADATFRGLLDQNWIAGQVEPGARAQVDAVLYTNHALTGYAPQAALWIFGAVMSRDEALAFPVGLRIIQDIRTIDDGIGTFRDRIALPLSLAAPRLERWEVCDPSGC